MDTILTIATILGGFAAVWYFWDKWRARRSELQEPVRTSPPPVAQVPAPVEKWVDINYPRDSGLQERLTAAGFRVAWCLDTVLARKIDLERWEIVVEPDAQGVRSSYKLRDRPANQTLVKIRSRDEAV